MKSSSVKSTAKPHSVGIGPLVAGLGAIAVGVVAPLFVGSFSRAEIVVLVPLEALCLLTVAIGAIVATRRLGRSQESLWELARRDELTGVGNYRALQERLSEEIARHSRRGRELALILVDLDGFKRVNDELGHLEGDRLLVEIGAALRDEVRAEDTVFRQGGDEFAVIAPETNGEEAGEVAARLRSRVRTCGGARVRISAATGCAIFPAEGRSAEELLRVADDDLLGTKRVSRS